MTVEVDDVIRIALGLGSRSIASMRGSVGGRQKSRLTFPWSGSSAVISARVREARINEPGVARPADDVEHPQRQLYFARHERFRRLQLAAHGHALREAAGGDRASVPTAAAAAHFGRWRWSTRAAREHRAAF